MAEYDPQKLPSIWRQHLNDPVKPSESAKPTTTLCLTQILWEQDRLDELARQAGQPVTPPLEKWCPKPRPHPYLNQQVEAEKELGEQPCESAAEEAKPPEASGIPSMKFVWPDAVLSSVERKRLVRTIWLYEHKWQVVMAIGFCGMLWPLWGGLAFYAVGFGDAWGPLARASASIASLGVAGAAGLALAGLSIPTLCERAFSKFDQLYFERTQLTREDVMAALSAEAERQASLVFTDPFACSLSGIDTISAGAHEALKAQYVELAVREDWAFSRKWYAARYFGLKTPR